MHCELSKTWTQLLKVVQDLNTIKNEISKFQGDRSEERNQKHDKLIKIGFFLEMRREEINAVSFRTKFQRENDSNQSQLSPELRRNNRRGVSRNAELILLQLGFKRCLGVFNRGDDLLPATSTFDFLCLWFRRYSCSLFEQITTRMLFGISFVGEGKEVVWRREWV